MKIRMRLQGFCVCGQPLPPFWFKVTLRVDGEQEEELFCSVDCCQQHLVNRCTTAQAEIISAGIERKEHA